MNLVKQQDLRLEKSVPFLDTDNELSEREGKNILFKIISKRKKIARNKLNQGGKRPVFRKLLRHC